MGAIAYVSGLRVLRIEDLHCRLEHEAVTDLGALTQVRNCPLGFFESYNPAARQTAPPDSQAPRFCLLYVGDTFFALPCA